MPQDKLITCIYLGKSESSYLFVQYSPLNIHLYNKLQEILSSGQQVLVIWTFQFFAISPTLATSLSIPETCLHTPAQIHMIWIKGRKMVFWSLLYPSCDIDCNLDKSKSYLNIITTYNAINRCSNTETLVIIL